MLKGIKNINSKLRKETTIEGTDSAKERNDSTENYEKSDTTRKSKISGTVSEFNSKSAKQSSVPAGVEVVAISKSSTVFELKPKIKIASEGTKEIPKRSVIRVENENVRYLSTNRKQNGRKASQRQNDKVKIPYAVELIRAFFVGVQTRKDLKQWLEKPDVPSIYNQKLEEVSTDPILRYLLYQVQELEVNQIRPEHHFPLKEVPQFIGSLPSENISIILIMGGINPTNHHEIFAAGGMILRYDPNGNFLNRYSMMPVPRHNHRVVYKNGFLYVIGGYDPRMTVKGHMIACNTCYRYELVTNTWERISDMNHARVYHGAVVLRNTIFVVGGKNRDGQLLNSVEKYDEKEDHWVLLEQGLSIARMAMGVATHEGMIWVAGGLVLKPSEENLCMVRIVERYDYAKNSWTLLKSRIPIPVAFPSLCSTKSSLFLLGGIVFDKQSQASVKSVKSVLRYNVDEDSWESDVSLRSARHDAATTTIGNTVYMVGGCDSNTMSVVNNVEEYDTVKRSSEQLQVLPLSVTGCAVVTLPVETNL